MSIAPDTVDNLNFIPQQELHSSPVDWRDQVIYFLLVDRFDDNKEHEAFSETTLHIVPDPDEGRFFQGGNLKGVTRRLDYLKNLGCTTVWLSPIFRNRQDKK